MPDRDSLIDAEYEPEDEQFGGNRADPWEKSIYQGECEREEVMGRNRADSTETVLTPRLHVQCSWCGDILEHGDPGAPVSHGICEDCAEEQMAELEAYKAGQAVEDRPAFCWNCCRLMTDPHCCEFCRPLKKDRSLREERP